MTFIVQNFEISISKSADVSRRTGAQVSRKAPAALDIDSRALFPLPQVTLTCHEVRSPGGGFRGRATVTELAATQTRTLLTRPFIF